jgi:hypothetical protein
VADRLDTFDAAPFIAVMTAVRDAGRAAKARGASIHDELVVLAYRAHGVLKWMEADQAEDYTTAAKWLDVAYGRNSRAGE